MGDVAYFGMTPLWRLGFVEEGSVGRSVRLGSSRWYVGQEAERDCECPSGDGGGARLGHLYDDRRLPGASRLAGPRTPLWIASLLGWPSCGVATDRGVEVGTALWSNSPAVAPRRLALRLSVDIGPSGLLLPRTLFAGVGRTLFATPKAIVSSLLFAFFRNGIPPVTLSP